MVADFQGYCSPYDGKEMSDKALEEATKFAKPLGSNIPILSVIDERYARPMPSFVYQRKKRPWMKQRRGAEELVLSLGAVKMLEEKLGKLKENCITTELV